ncbi:MAG: hypothetical protein EA350_15595, partial [Gemmatimonadales bacterium]
MPGVRGTGARRRATGFLFLLCPVFLAACGPAPLAQGPAPAAEERSRWAVPLELENLEEIRPEVAGLHGAVVAGHPLAAAAGYEVLRAGGNAADAAVTMAAVLAVVRPHMNGVGGDAFALFLDAGGTGARGAGVRVLNGSGRAGALADPAFFQAAGRETMPGSGALSVTVPGAVSAWAEALAEHGTFTLAQALAPAIRLAEEGFVVSPTLAADLSGATRLNRPGQDLYAPGGEPLRAGAVLRNPALARTLRAVADEGPQAMYGGSVGAALATFLETEGSPLRLADFGAHRATWEAPVSMEFLGRTVHTTGPNSQGFVLLQTLGIVDALGLEGKHSLSPGLLHELVEARKLAFADRDRWLADADHAPAPMARLLDREYLAGRAALIGDSAATSRGAGFGDPLPGQGQEAADGDGDTVYLMAVDADGNAVSWIQSLFSSFG